MSQRRANGTRCHEPQNSRRIQILLPLDRTTSPRPKRKVDRFEGFPFQRSRNDVLDSFRRRQSSDDVSLKRGIELNTESRWKKREQLRGCRSRDQRRRRIRVTFRRTDNVVDVGRHALEVDISVDVGVARVTGILSLGICHGHRRSDPGGSSSCGRLRGRIDDDAYWFFRGVPSSLIDDVDSSNFIFQYRFGPRRVSFRRFRRRNPNDDLIGGGEISSGIDDIDPFHGSPPLLQNGLRRGSRSAIPTGLTIRNTDLHSRRLDIPAPTRNHIDPQQSPRLSQHRLPHRRRSSELRPHRRRIGKHHPGTKGVRIVRDRRRGVSRPSVQNPNASDGRVVDRREQLCDGIDRLGCFQEGKEDGDLSQCLFLLSRRGRIGFVSHGGGRGFR
mmetsp:Transcript_4517/g.9226  ORF Transcript_4517/g.9226 Transcript_4517/m.9226 type:complete len:386 (-) Transcript_4517:247-1404(-)